MLKKRSGLIVLVLAVLGLVGSPALADEIVHFTNGAEMPVRSHTVDKDNSMVKLDLGGNSFISFPMSMVDKIISAGQDVYKNPEFHASNQALAGDGTVRGMPAPVGYVRQADDKGHAGMMLGEAADKAVPAGGVPGGGFGGPDIDNTVANSRKRFNPVFQGPPGGPTQVIMPPNQAKAAPPVRMGMTPKPAPEPPPPPPPPAPNAGTQDSTPPSDPPPEDPPDNP